MTHKPSVRQESLRDLYNDWAKTHNLENYGRWEAFSEGTAIGAASASRIADLEEIERLRRKCTFHEKQLSELMALNEKLRAALEKIADPRKREHKEPDAYTELGCVMNIAAEALK